MRRSTVHSLPLKEGFPGTSSFCEQFKELEMDKMRDGERVFGQLSGGQSCETFYGRNVRIFVIS
jgi:hypothetical protein